MFSPILYRLFDVNARLVNLFKFRRLSSACEASISWHFLWFTLLWLLKEILFIQLIPWSFLANLLDLHFIIEMVELRSRSICMIFKAKSCPWISPYSALSLILILLHSWIYYIRISSVSSFVSQFYILRHEISLFFHLLLFRHFMRLHWAMFFFLQRQVRHFLTHCFLWLFVSIFRWRK